MLALTSRLAGVPSLFIFKNNNSKRLDSNLPLAIAGHSGRHGYSVPVSFSGSRDKGCEVQQCIG